MFSFSSSSAILSGRHDSAQERAAPALPTPVVFPDVRRVLPPTATLSTDDGLVARFLRLRRPSDLTPAHLSCLAIRQPVGDASFDHLVPARYLPPPEWLHIDSQDAAAAAAARPAPAADGAPKRLLSNGRQVPDRREFTVRLKELLVDKEDAFASLTRKPRPGQASVRLAHFRRFWEGLDNMAYYWDTSQDCYLPPPPSPDGEPQPEEEEDGDSSMNLDDDDEPRKKAKPNPAPEAPTPKYRGHRISTGTEMPDQYRLETVRSFLEPILWAHGVTMLSHRRQPTLQLGPLRQPVRVNTAAWRTPLDRARARAGWVEGPVFGIQIRNEVADALVSPEAALLDAISELGALLFLAQERGREGKEDHPPGEGKWWTTVPRWGGGAGGEAGEGKGNSDEPLEKPDAPAAAAAAASAAAPPPPPPPSLSSRLSRRGNSSRDKDRPKKLTGVEAWKLLRSGSSLWDPKTEYRAIGRGKNSDHDEVYLISSLNHHISIVRLRITPAYLDYLEQLARASTSTDSVPALKEADYPVLDRTRWLDLFNADDRLEAMRGLWGLTAYLLRAESDDDDDEATGSSGAAAGDVSMAGT